MLEKLIQGGPIMIPLMICSVTMLAVLIDRFLAFRAYSKIDSRSLRAEILTFVEEDRILDAKNLCASTPGPVSALLLVGLQTYEEQKALGSSPERLRNLMGKAMDDFTPHAIHAVEKRLNWLATITNVSPLFGMVGTVTGMIKSFGSLKGAGSLDAGTVGAGISEALVATATGLIIALSSVIPYNGFLNKIERINLDMAEASSELIDMVIKKMESAVTPGK